MAKRIKTISGKYVDHLEHIARIFLDCRENSFEAAKRVAEQIPGLKAIQANRFYRWVGNVQWEDALAKARDEVAFENEFRPQVRGRSFLRWARETLKGLKTQHEEAVEAIAQGDKKAAEKQALEARIVKLNEAIRAEEKHQEDLADRAARRDMRTFARNAIELFGTFLNSDGLRRLQEIQRDPTALMKGIE